MMQTMGSTSVNSTPSGMAAEVGTLSEAALMLLALMTAVVCSTVHPVDNAAQELGVAAGDGLVDAAFQQVRAVDPDDARTGGGVIRRHSHGKAALGVGIGLLGGLGGGVVLHRVGVITGGQQVGKGELAVVVRRDALGNGGVDHHALDTPAVMSLPASLGSR